MGYFLMIDSLAAAAAAFGQAPSSAVTNNPPSAAAGVARMLAQAMAHPMLGCRITHCALSEFGGTGSLACANH